MLKKLVLPLLIIMIIATGAEYQTHEYDVIVVGSDPEGIAAAIAASREGANTLLIDDRDRVGGLYTLGMLNMLDLNYTSPGSQQLLNEGIFLEFYRGIGKRSAFDIQTAEEVFLAMLEDAGVSMMLETDILELHLDDQQLKAITIQTGDNIQTLTSKKFIDATQDGDIAAGAGAPYTLAREELGIGKEYPAATLVFQLGGIQWDEVKEYLNNDNNPYTGANNWAAWGYAEMYNYISIHDNLQMRGLNLGRQNDDTVLVNALQLFHVDPFSQESRDAAYQAALFELPEIIKYMQSDLPGFADAYLVATAPELYIRESRHIQGEEKLTAEHVFASYIDEWAIAYGSYPIDLQSPQKGKVGHALSGTSPYGITLGMLVPLNVDNLLVVGKAASYDPIAHGSARTIPVGMATGQAAGIAATYSIKENLDLRTISKSSTDIAAIRDLLTKQGVNLEITPPNHPEKDHWAFPYIQYLRDKGLLSRGYNNDYLLDEPITKKRLTRMLTIVNDHSSLLIPNILHDIPEQPDSMDILKSINNVLSTNYSSYLELYQDQIIDTETLKQIENQQHFNHAQIYAILAGVISHLQ